MTLIGSIFGKRASAQAKPPLSLSTIALASPNEWSDRSGFTRTTFAEIFGTDSLPITRETGMAMGVLAKARNVLTTTTSGFPLVAMSGNARMEQQPLICRQPEIGRARSTTILWAMDSMFWYGRAWYLIQERYAEDQRPKRIQWVPEWNATVDGSGILVEAFGKPVAAMDVIRVDGPHEGVLNYAAPRIREAIAIDLAAANAADNPVPSVDLHQTGGTPMTDTEVDALLARWVAARKKRGGGVGYTNPNVEAKSLGIQPEQLLLGAKAASDLGLIRASGAPAWVADVAVEGSALTYSNSPSRSRELIDYFAGGYMTAFADRFSMDDILPAGQWCRFDTTGLLQGNFKERMEGYKAAVDAGVYTAEECRQIEEGIALEGI